MDPLQKLHLFCGVISVVTLSVLSRVISSNVLLSIAVQDKVQMCRGAAGQPGRYSSRYPKGRVILANAGWLSWCGERVFLPLIGSFLFTFCPHNAGMGVNLQRYNFR